MAPRASVTAPVRPTAQGPHGGEDHDAPRSGGWRGTGAGRARPSRAHWRSSSRMTTGTFLARPARAGRRWRRTARTARPRPHRRAAGPRRRGRRSAAAARGRPRRRPQPAAPGATATAPGPLPTRCCGPRPPRSRRRWRPRRAPRRGGSCRCPAHPRARRSGRRPSPPRTPPAARPAPRPDRPGGRPAADAVAGGRAAGARRDRRVERGIVGEDGRFQPGQLGARFEAELLPQHRAGGGEGAERVGLAARR